VGSDLARGSLRLSFGHTTTASEVADAADVIGRSVERVREATRRLGSSRN